jgi:hypothetical protein
MTRPAMSLANRRVARALARRRMLFSLSLKAQIPLESMSFLGCEIHGDINNPFSYLWRVFHPWACLPFDSKL